MVGMTCCSVEPVSTCWVGEIGCAWMPCGAIRECCDTACDDMAAPSPMAGAPKCDDASAAGDLCEVAPDVASASCWPGAAAAEVPASATASAPPVPGMESS